jgi:2-oxoglutarate ferredoxin oxidoreductase subunit alpha
MTKELLKGNVAFAESAVRNGLQAYFGYPITPQSEGLEHLAKRMPEEGRIFLQAESEIAAINMVYGAACAGVRTMTSTSGPGLALMAEGLSYIAGSEVPVVVVNMMRGGPGLGNIQPSQADYFFMTKTAGHGDFHPIVLAPASVQELIDMMGLAFELAEKYKTLVLVAGDGCIGQMMESAELPPMQPIVSSYPEWAVTGAANRDTNLITSLYLGAKNLEQLNQRLQRKLDVIESCETRYVEYRTEDCDVLLVAYGSSGRISYSAVRELRKLGIKAGLFRPLTLWPYPKNALYTLSKKIQGIYVVEMSAGQMLEDVNRIVDNTLPVSFYGCMGGVIPMVEDIIAKVVDFAQDIIQPRLRSQVSFGNQVRR